MPTPRINDAISEAPVHLAQGILLYSRQGGAAEFATVHDIERDSEGPPRFLPGEPITREAVVKLSALLTGQDGYDFLPPELLAIGGDWMVWHSRPGPRALFFDTQDTIGKLTEKVDLPMLVFAVKAGAFYVFAVEGSVRPTPDTPLHHAPFYNTWGTDQLCLGNASTPARHGPETMRSWEEGVFFGSAFTHPNHDAKRLTTHRGGVSGLWKAVLRRKPPRLELDDCASAGVTLAMLVKRMKNQER